MGQVKLLHLGQVAHGSELGDRCGPMPLGHLAAIGRQNEGQVAKHWRCEA